MDTGYAVDAASGAEPAVERTGSIARSISWSYWWRRIVYWLLLDILLVGAVFGTFCYSAACSIDVLTHEGIGTHFTVKLPKQRS